MVFRDRVLKQLAGTFGGNVVDLHFTNPKSMSSPTMVYMVALFSVVLRDRDLKQLAGAFGGDVS